MRSFNHQSIVHAIRSALIALSYKEALGISTLEIEPWLPQTCLPGTCLFPVSHYELSSLECALQLHSSRRPWQIPQTNAPKFIHLTNPTWSAACCSNVAKRLSKHCRSSSLESKIDARSHWAMNTPFLIRVLYTRYSMRCTCFEMFSGHVSRNFLNISTLVRAFLQSGFGCFGIAYAHASGLLLAQLHSHFQTSKCRHLVPASLPNTPKRLKEVPFSHLLVLQNACRNINWNLTYCPCHPSKPWTRMINHDKST